METTFITKNEAMINGKHVYLYQMETPIGNIFALKLEGGKDEETITLFGGTEQDKAEKKFKAICKSLLAGK